MLSPFLYQAYLFSLHMQAPSWDVQTSGLILFGTPHFLAGLAQWALISAKKLGIPCEDTPQQQDWSAEPIQENLKRIAGMQKEFRDLDTEPKMACYFSWLQVPESKLVSRSYLPCLSLFRASSSMYRF